ncbi:MAG: MFS transporter [Actinomycetota bacterium]
MSRPAPGAGKGVLWTVALGLMLVPLNSTMIIVALPSLIDDFSASVGAASWLVTSYLIAMASLQPVAGKLGDRMGRRPLMLGGLGWFALSSAGAAASWSLGSLIFFRVQQAVAAALLVPNGIALLREVTPGGQLGKRIGLVGATLPLAAAIGPPLGGLLIEAGGWQAIFLVNLPFLVSSLLLGWRSVPRQDRPIPRGGFDLAGGLGLTTLLVGTAALGKSVWSGPASAIVAVALAAVLAVFVRRELRHPDPVLQPRLFARARFSAANAAVAASNLAMYVTLVALSILLARRDGWSAGRTGLALAALSLAACALAPVGGRLTDRLGRRIPATCGLALLALSLAPLAVAPADIPLPILAGALVAGGAGLGLASSALQLVAIESVEAASTGVAAGVFSTSRYFGSIVGTSLLAGALAPSASGPAGFRPIFLLATLAAAASAMLGLAFPGRGALDPMRATTAPARSESESLQPARSAPRAR